MSVPLSATTMERAPSGTLNLKRYGLIILLPLVQGRRELRGGKWQRIDGQKKCSDGRPKRRAALESACSRVRRRPLTAPWPKVAEVDEWRDRFLLGAENGFGARQKDDEALGEEEINRLKRKVGELKMDLDICARPHAPTTLGTSDE